VAQQARKADMQKSGYPSLYQINTRVWLTELSRKLGRSATLDDIPDTELDRIAEMGFDWVWFLSVWQTGLEGQRVSSQCYVRLPFSNLRNQQWWLEDLLSDARYDRDGNDLASSGLYLDLALWCYLVFRRRRLLIPSVEVTSCLRSAKIS
jgi:hypothetical protein